MADIGYFSWYTPYANIMPAVSELLENDTSDFGVAPQGGTEAWPIYPPATLPVFDRLGDNQYFIEVFPRGTGTPQFEITGDKPWIKISEGMAFSASSRDRRFWVSIDWPLLPPGRSRGKVIVKGGNAPIEVHVEAVNATAAELANSKGAFGNLTGVFSIAPEKVSRTTRVAGVTWQAIKDYGRFETAMSLFPVTAKSFDPGGPAPTLEYSVFFPQPGSYMIDLVTGPTLNVDPSRKLSIGVAVGDAPVNILSVFTPEAYSAEDFLGKAHEQTSRDSARIMRSSHIITQAGVQKLRIIAIDPTLVLQKIIISDGNYPKSYFGPPVREATMVAAHR